MHETASVATTSKQSSVTRQSVLDDAAEALDRSRGKFVPVVTSTVTEPRSKTRREELYGLFSTEVQDMQRNVERLQQRLREVRVVEQPRTRDPSGALKTHQRDAENVHPTGAEAPSMFVDLRGLKPRSGVVLPRGPPSDVMKTPDSVAAPTAAAATTTTTRGDRPVRSASRQRRIAALVLLLQRSHDRQRRVLEADATLLAELSRHAAAAALNEPTLSPPLSGQRRPTAGLGRLQPKPVNDGPVMRCASVPARRNVVGPAVASGGGGIVPSFIFRRNRSCGAASARTGPPVRPVQRSATPPQRLSTGTFRTLSHHHPPTFFAEQNAAGKMLRRPPRIVPVSLPAS